MCAVRDWQETKEDGSKASRQERSCEPCKPTSGGMTLPLESRFRGRGGRGLHVGRATGRTDSPVVPLEHPVLTGVNELVTQVTSPPGPR